jgi:cytochrome c peroxidase
MKHAWFFAISLGLLVILWNCHGLQFQDLQVTYPYPLDNAPDDKKIDLGRALFFDKRLSKDGTLACADCHRPEFAFTDRKPRSVGINGQLVERNAPSLLNSAFLETVMFDAHLKTLELQVIVPIQEPSEMGHNMKLLIPKLRSIPEYQKAAKEIFNRDFDAWVLTRSLAAFERSLLSLNSRYDQYVAGNKKALNKDEIQGMKLFNASYCSSCHPAPYFTHFKAENNGFYTEGSSDKGRFRVSLDSNDIGRFKTPSLRNIALTYPYMHDGSLATIEAVINHYATGTKNNPRTHPKITPFSFSPLQTQQLKAFLFSLTDTTYLKNY